MPANLLHLYDRKEILHMLTLQESISEREFARVTRNSGHI